MHSFLKATLISLLLAGTFSACKVQTVKQQRGLPPGQAKKVAGQQSAKSFAPGQVKKKKG